MSRKKREGMTKARALLILLTFRISPRMVRPLMMGLAKPTSMRLAG